MTNLTAKAKIVLAALRECPSDLFVDLRIEGWQTVQFSFVADRVYPAVNPRSIPGILASLEKAGLYKTHEMKGWGVGYLKSE